MSSEQAKELRKQGIAAAKAGQKEQARGLLMQSLRLDPGSEAGWLWLISVARDQREKMLCLQKLLEINPNNDKGLQTLQALGLTREQLAQQVAGGSAPAKPQAAEQPLVKEVRVGAQPPPPQPPGVPMPDPQRIVQLQARIDSIVREYLAPPEGYPGVTWVQKTSKRAGERDGLVLRGYIAGGVVAGLVALFIIGYVIVWNTPALRGVVFVPTPTLTPSPLPPTFTPTPTPGVTPTPSPTPELTLTPSPTVPAEIPNSSIIAPQSTPLYPPALEKGIRDSISLLDRGDYAGAIPTLQVEITRVSSSFDAVPYYYTALALAEDGQLELAERTLLDAETRLPERPSPAFTGMVNAALAYVELLRAEEALADNNRDQARSLLSTVEDRAETAIENDPRLELPYIALARRFSLDSDYDLAVDALDRGLAIQELRANVKLIVEKGRVYFQQEEYELAAYQAFLALYVDPTTEPAHLLQIETALAKGEPGLAVLYAQTYLFYYPGSAQGYKLLGDARVLEGNDDLALEAYNQALTGGDNAEVLIARANLFTQERRYEQAREDLTRAFNLTDDPAVQALRMQAAYSAGNYSTAQSDAEDLLGTGVIDDSQIQLLQARILIDQARSSNQADFEEALNLLTNVGNDLPDDLLPIADEYRARAQYNLESYDRALEAINEALAAAETGSRHYLRGLILEAQGETEAARREYDWVLTLGQIYPYSFLPDARNRLENLSTESD
ncbi:MAG: tetratricopeptide repeat protein [Anaerolineae bacterium]|nr:tetratricopeptide repeat protein [Anaerolineae bacterium]